MPIFNSTVQSDFLKLGLIPESRKSNLIDFAGTDFLTLKANLITYLQAVYPLDYSNLAESDLGVTLLELVAYMGAVLSMKADMLANENFLATAQNRNNVNKILQLLGVSFKGPLSAAADASLTFRNNYVIPSTSSLTIPVAKRVINIMSPEDGAPVNYTLYKTSNGLVEFNSVNTDLILSGNLFAGGTECTNLVLQEGALVTQTGTFSQVDSGGQTIELTQSPIIEGSVQIFINGPSNVSGVYREVENLFYASGTNDKIFQKVYDDNFKAVVVFGDNILGVAPTPGSTYTVSYRIGGGSRGNIRNSVINVLINGTIDDGSTKTCTLENVSVATGGADAETVEHAKKYAPYSFRRQDRLVTGDDFTVFANNYVGTLGTQCKAIAAVRKAYSSANIIDVYVLEKASTTQLQKASVQTKTDLLTAMEDKKMLTDELVIVDGVIRGLDLVVSVKIDRELKQQESVIKLKIKDKIVSFFDLNNRDFGQTLVLSDFNRALFELPEVRYATVDNLDNDVVVDFNEIISLNNFTINIVYV